jgi:hypothetical protein
MQFLAPLIFNKFFISEFIKADHSSAAIGILEEFGIQRGFIAIKPESLIPDKFTRNGINFGHQLLGDNHNTKSTMIRFTIKIYNYKEYHFFLNPNNDLVRKILHIMNDSGEIFQFIFNETGLLAFRDKIDGDSKYWFNRNLKTIDKAENTEEEYLLRSLQNLKT